MFANVRKAAISSTSDMSAFREQWTSEQTQGILDRGKEGGERDAEVGKK